MSTVIAGMARVGDFFAMVLGSFRAMFRRPFPIGEVLEQTVFIAGVCILPVIFVTIPFTVLTQFFLGQLTTEIGGNDISGAGAGLAVVQELGPMCSVLVVAGAGATAVTADLGARKIREELDALQVMGLDPLHRLVAPRIIAFIIVTIGLSGIVMVVGLAGTMIFSVLALHSSPGLFLSTLTLITSPAAFWTAIIKTATFGTAAALVACYLGINAKGGPKGVGEAVNQTVVFTLMILMALNTVITGVFLQVSG
ncbi:MAG: MlaE family ABC transporter permease [Aeromicrobium sp.]